MSTMGQDLTDAVQEALDHSEGKIELRTTHLSITPVCDTISVDEIKETRKKLGMSQGVFAIVIGVSKKTVESWESGRYTPDGAARRLISIIQKDPMFPEKYNIVRKPEQDASGNRKLIKVCESAVDYNEEKMSPTSIGGGYNIDSQV